MIITGAKVFTDRQIFEEKDIYIKGERITENSKNPSDAAERIDATGMYVIPGLIDIHFHGAMGHDFSDADIEGLEKIAEYEASRGILAICPATMTLPFSQLVKVMENAKDFSGQMKFSEDRKSADLIGINLEGPFISTKKPGSQKTDNIVAANYKQFMALQEESGNLIKLVDIAPETENAMDFIAEMVRNKDSSSPGMNVGISIAHTAADYETSAKAFERGASHVTHLFNAMNGINHRNPGPVIAALEHHAEVELIADGVHVHPAMVRFVFNTFDKDKIILISDSMRATGLGDGKYDLGGQSVTVAGNLATLSSSPEVIAASVTNLYECMKNAINFGVPRELAVAASTINPAKSIGADRDYGSILAGKYANLLIVDSNFNIQTIILRGKIIDKAAH